MKKSTLKKPTRALSGISELNYDSGNRRKTIKVSFMKRDKDQIINQVKDLEKTIAINKEIIGDLVEGSNLDEANKKVLKALNEENSKLRKELRVAIEERNSFQSKLLIAEQIIEDDKGKINTFEEQMKEHTDELLDQLNRKEYVLQSYERKLHTVLDAIKRYGSDTTIRKIITKMNIDLDKDKRITNIVEENALLTLKLETARTKIIELENKILELTKSKDHNNSTKESSLNTKGSFNSSLSDSAQLSRLRVKLKELAEENEITKKALGELQIKNENLSLELNGARKEIRTLKVEAFKTMLDDRRRLLEIRDDNLGGTEVSSNSIEEPCIPKDDIIEFMSDC